VKNNEKFKISASGEIVVTPFIRTSIGPVDYIAEYVGYMKVSRDSEHRMTFVYKITNAKGKEKNGHILSEYGLGEKSILAENKRVVIPEEREEDYLRKKLMITEGDKEVDRFIYLPQSERLSAYTRIVKERKLEPSEHVAAYMKGSINSLKMTEEHEQQIVNGDKTATSRSYEQDLGLYKLPNGNIIELLTKTHYNSIDDMSDPETWAQAEGYKDLEDFKKNAMDHVKKFINGKADLWVYSLRYATEYQIKQPAFESDYQASADYDDALDNYRDQQAAYDRQFNEDTKDDVDKFTPTKVNEALSEAEYSNKQMAQALREYVKTTYGEEELTKLNKALQFYNTSEEAKKQVDQLILCISLF